MEDLEVEASVSEEELYEVDESLPPVQAILKYSLSDFPPQQHAYIKGIGAVADSASPSELRQLVACVSQVMAADHPGVDQAGSQLHAPPRSWEVLAACLGQFAALGTGGRLGPKEAEGGGWSSGRIRKAVRKGRAIAGWIPDLADFLELIRELLEVATQSMWEAVKDPEGQEVTRAALDAVEALLALLPPVGCRSRVVELVGPSERPHYARSSERLADVSPESCALTLELLSRGAKSLWRSSLAQRGEVSSAVGASGHAEGAGAAEEAEEERGMPAGSRVEAPETTASDVEDDVGLEELAVSVAAAAAAQEDAQWSSAPPDPGITEMTLAVIDRYSSSSDFAVLEVLAAHVPRLVPLLPWDQASKTALSLVQQLACHTNWKVRQAIAEALPAVSAALLASHHHHCNGEGFDCGSSLEAVHEQVCGLLLELSRDSSQWVKTAAQCAAGPLLAQAPAELVRSCPVASQQLLRLCCDAALSPRPPPAVAREGLARSLGPAALRLVLPGLISWGASRLGQALNALLESKEPSVAVAAVLSVPDLAAALTGRQPSGSGSARSAAGPLDPGPYPLRDPALMAAAAEATCSELLAPLLNLAGAAADRGNGGGGGGGGSMADRRVSEALASVLLPLARTLPPGTPRHALVPMIKVLCRAPGPEPSLSAPAPCLPGMARLQEVPGSVKQKCGSWRVRFRVACQLHGLALCMVAGGTRGEILGGAGAEVDGRASGGSTVHDEGTDEAAAAPSSGAGGQIVKAVREEEALPAGSAALAGSEEASALAAVQRCAHALAADPVWKVRQQAAKQAASINRLALLLGQSSLQA